MDVYKFDIKKKINSKEFSKNKSTLLLGEFELFHRGHYQLFEKAKSISGNNDIGILLIIKEDKIQLQTLENKLTNLANIGFNFVLVAKFDFEFKCIEGKDFINYIDNNFNVENYIVGHDFKFGKNRSCSAKDIKNISKANVEVIDLLKIEGVKISSSDIKQMHEFGEYNLIKNLLVNPLIFDVSVIEGKMRWEQIVQQPHTGNYFFKILIDDYWYHGIINFSIDKDIKYELINFDSKKNIFDQKTKIQILDIERIITNQRFDQISNEDIEKTKRYFSRKED